MWDEIYYRFPIFNLATVEVREWISNFTQHFTGHLIMDYWENWQHYCVKGFPISGTQLVYYAVCFDLLLSMFHLCRFRLCGEVSTHEQKMEKSFSRLICDHVNWDVIWVPRGKISFMQLRHNLYIPIYIIEMKLWHFSVFLDNLLPSLGKICFNMIAYVACSTGWFWVITWLHVTVMVKWPKSSSKHMEIVHLGKSSNYLYGKRVHVYVYIYK